MSLLTVDIVRELYVDRGLCIADVCAELEKMFGTSKGFRRRTVQRFLAENNITSALRSDKNISNNELDLVVSEAVNQVGGKYGRRMMTGLLQSKGVLVGERRVRNALQRVAPTNHGRRQRGAEKQLNPQVYHAPYMGYNLHLDQNEKLVDFGVTYVVSIDGASSFIPAYSVMARKNNIRIYRDILRYAAEKYGLWETVVVDHGREFYLALFMQKYWRNLSASNTGRMPYKQIRSTDNNRIERVWSEVNQRVSFPIKYAMINLEQQSDISHLNDYDLFSMSSVCCPVARHGISLMVDAWNFRRIPGHGVPISYTSSRQTTNLDGNLLISDTDAAEMYRQSGGTLTDESVAGVDPVADAVRQQRDELFWNECETRFGSVADIFGAVANKDYIPIQSAVMLHRDLSLQLQ